MSVIHTPKKPELELRILIFPIVMFALLAVLFSRFWYFQVVRSADLVEQADRTKSVEVTSPAPRGLIFDRSGNMIAGVKPEVVITAVPSIIKKNPQVLDKLASLLAGIDLSEISDPEKKQSAEERIADVKKKLQAKLSLGTWRPYLPTPIFAGATIQTGILIAEEKNELPGIDVPTPLPPMRYYPDGLSFAHLLGYVWTPNKDDVKRLEKENIKPGDYVGKTALERSFESALMGSPGSERLQIDAKRRPVRVAERNISNPGNQLYLSIDSILQKYATKYMTDHGYVGGVVALDPKTGEILCLVSSPTFDLNKFVGGISDTDYSNIMQDPNKPMIDRAIRTPYPPGSTFKIVTSVAAYEAGKFRPDMTYFCGGGVRLGKHAWFGCLGHHGQIDFEHAITKSCNSFFYQLGRDVGEDALRKASLEMGLGQQEGIEIGGEAKGVVPTTDFVKRYYGGRYSWHMGDTFNFAIGQGFVSATPLQLANMISLVANRGTSYKPHLVREIRSADGKTPPVKIEPEVEHHVEASTEFWDSLQRGLVGVLQPGGTAYYNTQGSGLSWAGKTGSAEHGSDKKSKPNAVFVGYSPVESPKIAICVVVDNVGHGGEFAAPIARDLIQAYLKEIDAASLSKAAASASASSANLASPSAR